MEIALVAPPGWATDGLGGLLRKLAPEAKVDIQHKLTSIDGTGSSPDLLVLDVDLSPARAQALIQSATRSHPSSRLVAMGTQADKRHAEGLVDAGALTYLPHGFSESVILGTLRLILENLQREKRTAKAESEPAPVSRDADPATFGEEFGLTKRQAEVLSLICEAKSNRKIAQELGITEGVVKLHVTAINRALNVRSRAEAMMVASRSEGVNLRQIKRAEGGKLDLDWLLGHMTHQRLTKDTVLFKMGDGADCLYYLQRGTILLQEIGEELQGGTMFGEIGIFAPNHKRTCSAICAGPTDVFKLTTDQVNRLYLLNPQFALYIVRLISQRLMADRARVT